MSVVTESSAPVAVEVQPAPSFAAVRAAGTRVFQGWGPKLSA